MIQFDNEETHPFCGYIAFCKLHNPVTLYLDVEGVMYLDVEVPI